MKVNKLKESEINFGDIIHYEDGSTYMICETSENKYVWVNLSYGRVGTIEFDNIEELVLDEFTVGYDVFKNENIELNLK